VLRLIIQYRDNILGDFFEKYLQQMITIYVAYKNAVDDQFKNWLEMRLNYSTMAQKTITGFTSFRTFCDQFSTMTDFPKPKIFKINSLSASIGRQIHLRVGYITFISYTSLIICLQSSL
jgi:hypothetical protein